MKIDLTEIRSVLASVDRLLVLHDGKELRRRPLHAVAAHRDAAGASLEADLLAARDYLQLASAEVTTLYRMAQGRDDPRSVPGHRWPMTQAAPGDTNSRCGTAPRSATPQGRPG